MPLLCAPRGAVTHWAKLGWRRAARQAAAGPCCYIRVATGCGGRGRRSATSIPLSKPLPRREGPLKAGAAEPTFQFPSRRHWDGARGCWDPADPDSRARRRPLETVSSPGAVPVADGPRRRISPPARLNAASAPRHRMCQGSLAPRKAWRRSDSTPSRSRQGEPAFLRPAAWPQRQVGAGCNATAADAARTAAPGCVASCCHSPPPLRDAAWNCAVRCAKFRGAR